MKQKAISIKTSELDFVSNTGGLTLAGMLRSALDDAIGGGRSYPTGDGRRMKADISKTVVLLREEQHEFIQRVGMNFSRFASAVIQDRIEVERATGKLGEMDAGE